MNTLKISGYFISIEKQKTVWCQWKVFLHPFVRQHRSKDNLNWLWPESIISPTPHQGLGLEQIRSAKTGKAECGQIYSELVHTTTWEKPIDDPTVSC